jgi:Fe-S oxidoreductase
LSGGTFSATNPALIQMDTHHEQIERLNANALCGRLVSICPYGNNIWSS